jgi:Domain of unknown function (DUF4178)
MSAIPVVKPKALYCPNCGGPVELRGFGHSLTVVCPQCLSVLDATSPTFEILQKFQETQRIDPLIPLGTRGKFGGVEYEAIGFQERTVGTGDDAYFWHEYLLFNPYQGFRYLSLYNGHWNLIRMLNGLPKATLFGRRSAVEYEGRKYARFSSAAAQTTYVLGEFPWRVQVGDTVVGDDFISPPYMLSSEKTEGEVTWSRGEYTTGQQVWSAFQLPGKPPSASGVFPNQPSPFAGKVRSAWSLWLWFMVALAAIAMYFMIGSGRQVYSHSGYTFQPGATGELSFVTPDFDVPGRTSSLELSIDTDLQNNWIYFNMALINTQTDHALDFGREVSYYNEGGETEGSRRDHVLIPSVEAGKYYLRVEPEGNTKSTEPVHYSITLRRDVPNYGFLFLAALALLIPPIYVSIRAGSYETARWRESDFSAA